MLQRRERKIIQVLLHNHGKKTTSDELAVQLSVSSKTIKTDIKRINQAFSEKSYSVQTKKGQGIWLVYQPDDLNELRLISSFEGDAETDNRFRKVDLLMLLFDEKDYISVERLAEECYASSSTILRDLDELSPFFKKHQLHLAKEPRLGIKLYGKEISLRIARAETIKRLANLNQYVNDIVKVQESFPQIDLTPIKNIVETFQTENHIELSEIALKGLIIHIAISLQRLNQKKSVIMEQQDLKKIQERPEWQLGQQLAKQIEVAFGQEFDDSEAGYLTIHLMGANLANQAEENSLEAISEVAPDLLAELLNWTEQVDSFFGTDLLVNEKFISVFLLHLKPLLNRLKYNITIDNPWTKEIKQNYPQTFEIAVHYSKLIQEVYHLQLDEDEICYLAMHIGPAVNSEQRKPQEKIRVLIVCASGMGTSRFLQHKVESEFSQVKITGIVSSYDSMIESANVDLILSTIPLDRDDERIIYVSPVLNTEEKAMIENKLVTTHQETTGLTKLLSKELVLLDASFQSSKEAIFAGGELLHKHGYVDPGFSASVMQREELSPTAIGNLIAIPHAYQGSIKQQGIAIIQLAQPITWGNEKVQLVFLLAIDRQSQQIFMQIFDELVSFTQNTQRIHQAVKATTAEKIIELVIREEFK